MLFHSLLECSQHAHIIDVHSIDIRQAVVSNVLLPTGKTSKKASAEEDIELIAAREAAAVAAAAAAAKREAEIKQTLELQDAELAVAQQRNMQLQAQINLLVPNEAGLDPAAAAAAAAADVSSDPRVHQLLVAQVSSNMA